ncbi:MAG: CCA tRNA nucleotidyltransferase [Myxococcota bacterium]
MNRIHKVINELESRSEELPPSSLPPRYFLDGVPEPTVYERTMPPDRVDPDAIKVIRRLTRYGHTAYLVGGGVRDLLLGRHPKDFDVATSARPSEVRRLFRNCRVIGKRFRLAHILFAGGKVIEVATFRRDPELSPVFTASQGDEPARLSPAYRNRGDDTDLLIRNDNVFGDPHEDSIRRDFTINGLFYDLEHGKVIDYVGGMIDLERGVLRTIGSPDVRLREDPVRILRAIKFSARLDLGIEPDLYDAMVDHRGELAKSARPRLLEEILRLLRGGAAQRSVYLAWETGVLSEVLPEIASYLDDHVDDVESTWARLVAIDRRQRAGALPDDAVLLSALLSGPIEEWTEGSLDPANAFEGFFQEMGLRLSIPRRLRDRIRAVVASQRKLRTGRLGILPRREYFFDAAHLYALECEAVGRPIPSWADTPVSTADGRSRVRRRPRRRRRRDS